MTPPNEEVNSAISIAAGILTSSLSPAAELPVDNITISASAGSTLLSSEDSISQTSTFSFPSPNVLILTTSSTTTIPFIDPLIVFPTAPPSPQPTSDNIAPSPLTNTLSYDDSTSFVAPTSTINVAPTSTISRLSTTLTASLFSIPAALSTSSRLVPSYIIPTTLATLSSSSSRASSAAASTGSLTVLPTDSPSLNNSDSAASTTPDPTTSNESSSNNTGLYIGAAIGGVVFLILLIIALICLLRRCKHKHPKQDPNRPAFIGGYELKLDKAGDLKRAVHKKRVKRATLESWKKGVVPDLDSDNVAMKSEIDLISGTPRTGYSGSDSLTDLVEEAPTSALSPHDEVRGIFEENHDEYVVSPIEEEQIGHSSVFVEEDHEDVLFSEQKPKRPVSVITPLIFEWEKRSGSERGSPVPMIERAI